jgi:hypothetical protein
VMGFTAASRDLRRATTSTRRWRRDSGTCSSGAEGGKRRGGNGVRAVRG